MLYVYRPMCNCFGTKSQSETWTAYSLCFSHSLQKTKKSRFGILKQESLANANAKRSTAVTI